MKKIYNKVIIEAIKSLSLLLVVSLILAAPAFSQDENEEPVVKKKTEKPARPAFESAWWFDSQTAKCTTKKRLNL